MAKPVIPMQPNTCDHGPMVKTILSGTNSSSIG